MPLLLLTTFRKPRSVTPSPTRSTDDDCQPGSDPIKELFLGPDVNGNLIEVFANYDETHQRFVIFHAMKMRTLFYDLLD